jgi:hypothetical protein
MSSDVRITIDSVLDENHVRVLISTDGKTEKAIVMEKTAVKQLLSSKRLKRRIEGEVFSMKDPEKSVATYLRSRVPSGILREIPSEQRQKLKKLKKPESLTSTKRKRRIRGLQEKLRERMGGT